jgi:peptide/nickel transport system substrate-binding protein
MFMSENQAKAAAAGTLTGNVNFGAYQSTYISQGYASQVGPVVDPSYFTVANWLPEHILGSIPANQQATSPYATRPVGDGPYEVEIWNKGSSIELERSAYAFPLGSAYIKHITLRRFSDTAAVITALQNDQIDGVTQLGGLTWANLPDLNALQAGGKFRVNTRSTYSFEHIDINTTLFPTNDPLVRKALFYGLNRQAVNNTVYNGGAVLTDLPIPQGLSWAYTTNYVHYPYNPVTARQQLAAAGWNCSTNPCTKNGAQLQIEVATTDSANRIAIANAVADQWRQVGFGVTVHIYPGRTLFNTCSSGGPLQCRTFSTAIYTWVFGDDPQYRGLYDCGSIPGAGNGYTGQNYPGFCDAAADDALYHNEVDPTTCLSRPLRMPYLQTFFTIWTDKVPVIPLWNAGQVTVVRTRFLNWGPGSTQSSLDLWNAEKWQVWK